MNDTKRDAAREKAVAQAKEDARQYNHRHIDQHLAIPSIQVDDFSLRIGFDAGFEAANEWVEIRSADDLPKIGCSLWLQNKQGEIFTHAFTPIFQGNELAYYLETIVAYQILSKPEPYKRTSEEIEI